MNTIVPSTVAMILANAFSAPPNLERVTKKTKKKAIQESKMQNKSIPGLIVIGIDITSYGVIFDRVEKIKMQEKGLEPSWYCYHTDLNRARLPIPPFLHAKVILSFSDRNVNAFVRNLFLLLNTF